MEANKPKEKPADKCHSFLSKLLETSKKTTPTVAENIKNLIQSLINGTITEDVFEDQLQKEIHTQRLPQRVEFLRKTLPLLRQSLVAGQLELKGIEPPTQRTLALPVPNLDPTDLRKNAATSKSSTYSGSSISEGGNVSIYGVSASTNFSKPTWSDCHKHNEMDIFSRSGYRMKEDINKVTSTCGMNVEEVMVESPKPMITENSVNQIRSSRDETLIEPSSIMTKYKVIAAKYGLDAFLSPDASAILSYAVEEKLRTLIEKLSLVAEHRADAYVLKSDGRYVVTQDIKGQFRFLEALEETRIKQREEEEREMLMILAANSRSKSNNRKHPTLKAEVKSMDRGGLEEMRHNEANLAVLQAIGPRKKPKIDVSSGSSESSAATIPPFKPRLKRVTSQDLLFVWEQEKETRNSNFLYKYLLLK